MSENKPATDKPLFSIKDVLYFATIIGGFFISYFVTINSMKIELHDAISEISYNKKENDFRFAAVFTTLSQHEKKISAIADHQSLLAVKPKEIKIEEE